MISPEDENLFKEHKEMFPKFMWEDLENVLKQQSADKRSDMDGRFDDMNTNTQSEKGPPTIPSEKGPSITLSERGPSNTLSDKGPSITPSGKQTSITLSKKGPQTKPPEKGFVTTLHDFSSHFDKPYWNWSPIEKLTTMRPIDRLPPNVWKHEEPVENFYWDFPTPKNKFEVTQPPFAKTGALVMRVVGVVLGLMVVVLIISKLLDKKNRTRRGVVRAARAAAVEQNPQNNRSSPSEPESGPQNNDLPPSYQECTLYSINEYVGERPPPYTSHEDHKQPDAFIENERRNCSEHNAPEMRTELVFENGRIVERLSLDGNSKIDKKEAKNDRVVKDKNAKDTLVYV